MLVNLIFYFRMKMKKNNKIKIKLNKIKKHPSFKIDPLLKLYDKYVAEVLRVDGDGLIPRKNRKKS